MRQDVDFMKNSPRILRDFKRFSGEFQEKFYIKRLKALFYNAKNAGTLKDPKESFQDFIKSEGRYKSLAKTNPEEAQALYEQAEKDAAKRMAVFKAVGELIK